ncbi:ScbR family autoregulator-binding transcription factor [Streptomyces sp. NPDC102383]|uniref:ScbR family autoregulator-binding transcription factor n=1 Tax=Streptomyces sp. NPDC102383 TaxID=3366165 RepID=UPI0038243F45
MTQQVRAIRTRIALIRSAATLFEERGYTRTRLADISSGAGVSVGALHFHFDSKAAMSGAVQQAARRRFLQAIRATQRDQSDTLQQLINASHAIAGLLRNDVVVRAGLRVGHDETAPGSVDLREDWEAFVRHRLARAASQGVLRPPEAHHRLARCVVATSMGLEMLGRNDKSWLSPRTVTDIWELLLPALLTSDTTISPAGNGTSTQPSAPPTG